RGDVSDDAVLVLQSSARAMGLSDDAVTRIVRLAREEAAKNAPSTPQRKRGFRKSRTEAGQGTAVFRRGPEVRTTVREPRTAANPPAAGKETTIRIPGQSKSYRASYEVRELDDAHASHNPFNFEPNPHYYLVNDRDYSNPVNQSRVIENSKPEKF